MEFFFFFLVAAFEGGRSLECHDNGDLTVRWHRGHGREAPAGRIGRHHTPRGPHDYMLQNSEDLRSAATSLGRLLGRVDVEDILDVIFREFCIGK